MSETSEVPGKDPLAIQAIAIPNGGILGATLCPGKAQRSRSTHRARDLKTDLTTIKDWGAKTLVTLVPAAEFEEMGVIDLPIQATNYQLDWLHLPIGDFEAPGAEFDAAWGQHGATILKRLSDGERIVMHCAAGLGRTGTIAAMILTQFGAKADDAIQQVREARPGSIETVEQEAYVRRSAPSNP
jgi:ADP-ribosyl-[dinitrogen reductase] hydrolase